jgi:hypothetical protein
MKRMAAVAMAVMVALTVCAQAPEEPVYVNFIVENPHLLDFPSREAQKIYDSACEAVRQEFNLRHPVRPIFTLELGADRDTVVHGESGSRVKLKKWDAGKFAQGVVAASFYALMPPKRRVEVARRALGWAQATVDVEELK